MAKERHKIVPAAYLALIKDNKILLLLRANTGYEDGKYSMVSGHVEKNEGFTQGIIREAKEEAGIILKPEDLKIIHVINHNTGSEENNERIDVFFNADKWEGNIENKEPEKCDELSWFDLDNIPDNTIDFLKEVINCIKNKIFYSEQGYSKK